MIVAVNEGNQYTSIDRTMSSNSIDYTNALSNFKIMAEAYVGIKKEDDLEVPMISNRDNDRKMIKQGPIFMNCLCRTYGTTGPLLYILRKTFDVPPEIDDPLENNNYFCSSGSLNDDFFTFLMLDQYLSMPMHQYL